MTTIKTSGGEVVLFQTEGGKTRLEVQLEQDTVWLSLNQMTELFQRDKSVVSRHLNTIFKSDELVREATVAKNATAQIEGGAGDSQEAEFKKLLKIENWEVPIVEVTYSDAIF